MLNFPREWKNVTHESAMTGLIPAPPRPEREVQTFRYVKHQDVINYLRVGWHIASADLGSYHGQWAVLCVWLCECRCVEPKSPAA